MNKIADAIMRLAFSCQAEGIDPPTIIIADRREGDHFHRLLGMDQRYSVDPWMRDDLGKIWNTARFCGVKIVWPYEAKAEPLSKMLSSGVEA